MLHWFRRSLGMIDARCKMTCYTLWKSTKTDSYIYIWIMRCENGGRESFLKILKQQMPNRQEVSSTFRMIEKAVKQRPTSKVNYCTTPRPSIMYLLKICPTYKWWLGEGGLFAQLVNSVVYLAANHRVLGSLLLSLWYISVVAFCPIGTSCCESEITLYLYIHDDSTVYH